MKKYSPLRYPGGKGKLYSVVEDIILNNNLFGCTYVEPFAGGCEIAISLLINQKVNKIIINDYDKAIYAFWYSVLYHNEEIIEKILQTDVTIFERNRQKLIYENPNSSLFELGFATFFLNRVNRSGIISGGPISKKESGTTYPLNCRFNKSELVERIKTIGSLSDKIFLYNLEANDLLNILMNSYDEKIFIFFDPPYYVKGPKLYMNFFSHEDHLNLYNKIYFLNNYPKIYYIITYDDVDEILNLYKDFNVIHYDISYTVETKNVGNEVLFFSKNISVDSSFKKYISKKIKVFRDQTLKMVISRKKAIELLNDNISINLAYRGHLINIVKKPDGHIYIYPIVSNRPVFVKIELI